MTAQELYDRLKARVLAKGERFDGVLIGTRFTYEGDIRVIVARSSIERARERGLPIPDDALERAYKAAETAIDYGQEHLADDPATFRAFVYESVIAVFEP